MSTLIKNYPVFEDNQVLSSSQLNEMQGYLEQQNRLTRTSLIGIGIVCGMDLVCSPDYNKLTITKGVGVTSQGYLITIGKCETTRYRPYTKPDTVSYPPFEDSGTRQQDIELFELLTDDVEVDEEDTVTPLSEADEISEEENFPKDYAVLLFLEVYDKDLKSCLGKSCDELGINRIMTLRKLLISKSDLLKVKERTNDGMLEAAYAEKFEIPKLSIKRLTAPSENTWFYYIGLAAEYLKMIKEVWGPLFNAFDKSYNVYEPLLGDIYGENPFRTNIISDIKAKMESYLGSYSDFSEPVYGIQYFYDFVKELILAYEEFRLTAFELSGACCPDQSRFPKHLMLGEACGGSNGLCDDVKFRNAFVASPVFSEQRYLTEKVKMQHKRLVLMLESFDLERIQAPRRIKITPSCEKKGFTSDRAIPYYYDSKKESSFKRLGTLEKNWDFDLQRQCRVGEAPTQLSYDNNQPDSDRDDPITAPLDYDLDPYNFLRIEGHIGQYLDEMIFEFLEYKRKNNLPFAIKFVYIGALIEYSNIPSCLIEDLQPQYSIWRNKMLLFVKNLVQTSKTAEQTILNRHMLRSSEENDTYRAEDASYARMGDLNFRTSDFTNVFMGGDPTEVNKSANRLYEMMNNFKRASSAEFTPRTAAYESSEEISIRDLFSSLNDCLHQLIDAMPRDFEDFEMKTWLTSYKCTLRVIIRLMKWIAGRATTVQNRNQAFIYLVYMNLFYRVVSFLAIYPYITIRTLYDTYQERGQAWAKSLQLHEFRENHSGLEHKAGVAPGQTFLLVYQSDHYGYFLDADYNRIDENMFQYYDIPFASDQADLNFDRYLGATEEMEGRIVADFTLPFTCCDDCEDVPSKPVTLDPLACPVARIAMPKGGLKNDGHDSLEIQLINDLYEPDVYDASLTSDANFGTTDFREDPYEPDDIKTKQILIYDVDREKLEREKKIQPGAFFIIDEFDYQIKDTKRNEIVGSDTITIFIPVARQTRLQTGTVSGTVVGNSELLPGANVIVEGTQLGTQTNIQGSYSLSNIPTGSQTILASFVGYDSDRRKINVTTGANSVEFVLNQTDIIEIDYEFARVAHGFEKGTTEAKNLEKRFSTNMNEAKRKAEDIVKMEGKEGTTSLKKAAETVKEFTNEKRMNVVRLNNEYNKRRNELINEIQNKKGSEKELHKEALKNTTKAYLNRLAYTQPKDFSSTTKDVLNETATIINAEEDLDMKETIEDWQKGAKGYATKDFQNNLNDNFKLK